MINNVGGIVLADGSGADRGFGEPDEGQYDQPDEIFAWCGGSVLLRPSYLADVGLFDEHLFLYYEDTDLSWRGRALGWRYRVEPASVVHHLHAASTGGTSAVFRYYNERNRLVVLVKNAPAALARRAALRHPLSTLSYLRRALRGGGWPAAGAPTWPSSACASGPTAASCGSCPVRSPPAAGSTGAGPFPRWR